MKKIEILIVVIVLFLLAFVFGCKDKAEAEWRTTKEVTIDPNVYDIIRTNQEIEALEIKIEEKDRILRNLYRESNETKTYTAEELDEIYKDEPALGRLAKDLWGVGEGRIKIVEPNEPEITHTTLSIPDPNDAIWIDFDYDPYPTTVTLPRYTFEGIDFKEEITLELGGGSEIVCNVTENLFWTRMYVALSGKAPTEKVTLRFKPEPNEPEPESILEIGTGIWTCTICGKINHNYKEIIEHPCEPNEPETLHN